MKRMTDERMAEIESKINSCNTWPAEKYFRELLQALKAERAEVASLTNNMPKSAIDLERESFEMRAEVARLKKQLDDRYWYVLQSEAEERISELEADLQLTQQMREENRQRAEAAEAKLTNLESQWNDILAVQRRLKALNAKAWGKETPKP